MAHVGEPRAIRCPSQASVATGDGDRADLDARPAPLQDYLESARVGRLGLYFERLWHFWLADDPATTLLAHNVAVREDGRTLGEFDCLYHCAVRDRCVHLELAVKFYLWDEDTRHWLGPGARDRLDLKLEHLWQRQIRLSQQTAAQPVLQALEAERPLHEIEIKGYLSSGTANCELPNGYAGSNPPGRWLTLARFLREFTPTLPRGNWVALPREHWLAPAVS